MRTLKVWECGVTFEMSLFPIIFAEFLGFLSEKKPKPFFDVHFDYSHKTILLFNQKHRINHMRIFISRNNLDMNFQSTTNLFAKKKDYLPTTSSPIKIDPCRSPPSCDVTVTKVGKRGKYRAVRRNAVCFHYSPRVRAPKKTIRARFVAEELSSLANIKITTNLPSFPATPPLTQLSRIVSWTADDDNISVVSKEETDNEEMKELSNHLLGFSLFDDPFRTQAESTQASNSVNTTNSTYRSPMKQVQRITAARVTPRKKKRNTKNKLFSRAVCFENLFSTRRNITGRPRYHSSMNAQA